MIRRTLTAFAALSLTLSSMAAQAAAPVRPGAATVAAKPVRGLSLGDRVGAQKPEEASEFVGSVTIFVLLLVILASGAVVVAVSGDSSP